MPTRRATPGDVLELFVIAGQAPASEGAQVLAAFRSARVLAPFPRRGGEAGARWQRIIRAHERTLAVLEGRSRGGDVPGGRELKELGRDLFERCSRGTSAGSTTPRARSRRAGRCTWSSPRCSTGWPTSPGSSPSTPPAASSSPRPRRASSATPSPPSPPRRPRGAGAACASSDVKELRFKESDRIAAMTEGLRNLGVKVEDSEDSMTIYGGQKLTGGAVRSFADHRVAMSFAIAGLVSRDGVEIDDPRCAGISFPTFFDLLEQICLQ